MYTYSIEDLKEYRRRVDIYAYGVDNNKYKSYYNSVEETGNGVVHYSETHNDPNGPYVEVPNTSYSDCSGTVIDIANYRDFVRLFGNSEGIWPLYGDLGSRGILVSVKALEANSELSRIVYYLLSGEQLTESTYYEVEREIYQDQLYSWIYSSLTSELWKLDYPYPDSREDTIAKIERIVRENNIEWDIRNSNRSVHIDIDKVIEHWNDKRKYKHH